MPCPRVKEKRARRVFEELKGVFSVADCITAQTAMALTQLSHYRVWQYLKALAEVGYIEIHKIQRGPLHINLYCLPGKKPDKIYIYNGRQAHLIRLRDVVKALEEVLRSFATYTASVKIRHLKDALGLPNTATVGLILRHLVVLAIKGAVIREEARNSNGIYSLVLVVDKEKALKLIEEYKRGSSFS
jgi:hypothetical protein